MPAGRKSAKSRHKLSFAVDRSEIDISSDWVQAVMEPPAASAKRVPAPPAEGGTDSLKPALSTVVENNATVEPVATVVESTPVANNATVASNSPVAKNAAVAKNATAEENATGALFGVPEGATVEKNATVGGGAAAAVNPSTVVKTATVVNGATVEINHPVVIGATVENSATVDRAAMPHARRTVRLRPIQRITDGLTPGQYSVYSLMYERGESREGNGVRLFRGGYVDLVRLTGLSKRGIQNVIADLQGKSVIGIHQAPGYHRSQTTIYEVPQEQLVLERWFAKGWRYASGKSKNLVTIATVE